ncbi:dephospho-CoA kinase [Gilvimarinus sp. F26214L]|uniref:dephospho-CoA kinase n=1 Tax=Gilvimarinus sp. DZF01 TaxID=3461371 RepID=UPI00404618BA
MYVVGLTGGIGSGKSAVSALFESHGITVVDADIASRLVVEKGQPALEKIAEHFGPDILQQDGSLNRAALRKKIFDDAGERGWLERLLHPLIYREIQRQLAAASSPYAMLVSPLLVETGQNRLTQRILVVDVPEELQLERAMARDASSEEQIRAIMAAQASRDQRLKYADDVIVNDNTLEQLAEEVKALHEDYLSRAAGA